MIRGFKKYTVKPQMGASLVQGLAPDRLALIFNEMGGLGFVDYAKYAAISPVITTDVSIVQGKNGPRTFANVAGGGLITVGADAAIMPTGPVTIMFGYRKTDASFRNSSSFGNGAASTTILNCHHPFGDGTVYFDYGGQNNGTTRLQVSSLVFGDDIWAFTVGSRGMEMWQNGKLVGSNSANPTRVLGGNLQIFKGNSPSDLAECDFFYVWGSQIPQALIQQISASPFSVFRNPVRFINPGIPSGNLVQTLTDSLSLSDSLATHIGTSVLTLTLSDSLSLSDLIDFFHGIGLTSNLIDSLLLSDSFTALLAENPQYNDQFTLLDLIKIQLSLGFPLNDTLSFLDSLQVSLSNNLTESVSDSLSLSDSLVVLLSSDLDSYIRHYLNDVP